MMRRIPLTHLVMLRHTPLRPPRTNSRDVGFELLDLRPVGLRGELEEGVQGHLHPGAAVLGQLHEVGQDAAHDGLVGDDDDVLAALEFHDDGLEAEDDVAVGLAAAVAVVVLVVVAGFEVFGVFVGDFGVL